MICSNCGAGGQNGNYCIRCGTMLHHKVLNYENTNTLMRSNVTAEQIRELEQQATQREVQYTSPAQDSMHQSPPQPPPAQASAEEDASIPELSYEPQTVDASQIPMPSTGGEATQNADVYEDINTAICSDYEPESDEVSVTEDNPEVSPAMEKITEAVVPEVSDPEPSEVVQKDVNDEIISEEPVPNEPIAPIEVEVEAYKAEEPGVVEEPDDEITEDISIEDFTDLMSDEEPVPDEPIAPIEVEVEAYEAEEPGVVEEPDDEITEDISMDDFTDLMSDEEPVPDEPIAPIEVEVEAYEAEEPGVVEEPDDEIMEDISMVDFAEIMSEEETQPDSPAATAEPVFAEAPETVGLTADEHEPETTDLQKPVFSEALQSAVTEPGTQPLAGYDDIDPMFGPPPTMNFTSSEPPKHEEPKKKGFFSRLFKN